MLTHSSWKLEHCGSWPQKVRGLFTVVCVHLYSPKRPMGEVTSWNWKSRDVCWWLAVTGHKYSFWPCRTHHLLTTSTKSDNCCQFSHCATCAKWFINDQLSLSGQHLHSGLHIPIWCHWCALYSCTISIASGGGAGIFQLALPVNCSTPRMLNILTHYNTQYSKLRGWPTYGCPLSSGTRLVRSDSGHIISSYYKGPVVYDITEIWQVLNLVISAKTPYFSFGKF